MADAAPAHFPDPFQTPYRTEATSTAEDGAVTPVIVVRDGAKTRLELSTPEGEVVVMSDRTSGEITVVNRARRLAARTNPIAEAAARQPPAEPAAPQTPDMWWDGDVAASMSLVGACTHFDQTGSEWERDHENGPQHVCMTNDGIVLWATDNGRTTWETATVQRGAQDVAQFIAPIQRRLPPVEEEVAEGDGGGEDYTPPQFNTQPPVPLAQP